EILKLLVEMVILIDKHVRNPFICFSFRRKFNNLKLNTIHLVNNLDYIEFINNIGKDLSKEYLTSNNFLTEYSNRSVLKHNSDKISDKYVSNFCKFYLSLKDSSRELIMENSLLKG